MNYAFFIVALTSLSSSSLIVKWSQAPLEFLGFWRLVTAGLLLFTVVLFRHGPRPSRRPFAEWKWPFISGVFFFFHLWTYMMAAQNTSIAHMMILFATNPLFTMAGASLFFREKLNPRLFYAYPLALLGLWILVQEKVSFAPRSLWGDEMAFLSAALHAAYLLSSKRSRQNFDNLSFSTALYLITGMLFGILALVDGSAFMITENRPWFAVFALIILPTFSGHALMTYLVNKMEVSLLSCGKLLEPAISSLLAYFIFDEAVHFRTLIAFVLTASAVFLLFWPFRVYNRKARGSS